MHTVRDRGWFLACFAKLHRHVAPSGSYVPQVLGAVIVCQDTAKITSAVEPAWNLAICCREKVYNSELQNRMVAVSCCFYMIEAGLLSGHRKGWKCFRSCPKPNLPSLDMWTMVDKQALVNFGWPLHC